MLSLSADQYSPSSRHQCARRVSSAGCTLDHSRQIRGLSCGHPLNRRGVALHPCLLLLLCLLPAHYRVARTDLPDIACYWCALLSIGMPRRGELYGVTLGRALIEASSAA